MAVAWGPRPSIHGKPPTCRLGFVTGLMFENVLSHSPEHFMLLFKEKKTKTQVTKSCVKCAHASPKVPLSKQRSGVRTTFIYISLGILDERFSKGVQRHL